MRKIYNGAVLKQKIIDFNKSLLSGRTFVHPQAALRGLARRRNLQQAYGYDAGLVREYLGRIVRDYDRIIAADQADMLLLIAEFDAIIPHAQMPEPLWKDIVAAMRYKELREKEFLILIQSMGIKNCVYCHANLAVTVEKSYFLRNNPARNQVAGAVNEIRGLFQLDHRYAKSQYPFLCTTFYNLYPVCANCNQIKSQKESSFDLYAETNDLDIFNFNVKDESIVAYWAKKDNQLLEIAVNHLFISDAEAEAYLSMFDIREIYGTQKDLAEELIHKKLVYNDLYKKELYDEFRLLFPDQDMVDRMIIGNYDQPGDVHKRPMAKFVQDIARNIGLIK